jgi:hypothetical protein
MKLVLSILFSTLITMAVNAQDTDSWLVKWDGEKVLSTSNEDKTANTKTVKVPSNPSKSKLEIEYKPRKESLKRSFILFGKNDNELMRFEDTWSAKICYADLLKSIGDEKQIEIYTIAIPTDPDLAARVRVRRVHLCTLILQ